MNSGNSSDGALVLLGHGSSHNRFAAAPIHQHAVELRRRRIFAEVREAFWKQEPHLKQVLSKLSGQRVFIVPLFISEGYFSSTVIPRELGLATDSGPKTQDATLIYCKPVGTHPGMTDVLLARAREVAEKFPFPCPPPPGETTLFLAGHGTEQNENSRQAIERQVELIRATNHYAAVHGVFLEEAPRISQCYELAHTRNVVVVPFFISEGAHSQEDIPVLLGETRRTVAERLSAGQLPWRSPTERKGKLVWYGSVAGTAPQIADIVLERVLEGTLSRQSVESLNR